MGGYECGRYRPFPVLPGPEPLLPTLCGKSAGSVAPRREPRAPRPGIASPASGPCRGLAAAAQGFTSQRARTGAAERPSFSFPAARAAAAAATAIEIFRESSAPGAATRFAVDGPHGKPQVHVAAPDAGTAAASAADSQPDDAIAARPAARGEKCDPRSASHASRAARPGHRFGSLPKHVLAPGTRNPARSYALAAGACGWNGAGAAGVAALSFQRARGSTGKRDWLRRLEYPLLAKNARNGHPHSCRVA